MAASYRGAGCRHRPWNGEGKPVDRSSGVPRSKPLKLPRAERRMIPVTPTSRAHLPCRRRHRRPGQGCIGHPAFRTPSHFRGHEDLRYREWGKPQARMLTPRAHRAARTRGRICIRSYLNDSGDEQVLAPGYLKIWLGSVRRRPQHRRGFDSRHRGDRRGCRLDRLDRRAFDAGRLHFGRHVSTGRIGTGGIGLTADAGGRRSQ